MTLQTRERNSGVFFRIEYFDETDETLAAVDRLTTELKRSGLVNFYDFITVQNERPDNRDFD